MTDDDRPDPRQVERALEQHPNDTLAREVHALRAELEVERMCLAACGVAAHGAGDEHFANMRSEYDSDALRAVRAMRATLERVEVLRSRWLQSQPDTCSHACGRELHDALSGRVT